MHASHQFLLHEQTLWLSPERCIFWQEQKCLVVSDLHIGKTGHFRKAGIAVPQGVFKEDLQRLFLQVTYFKPERLIIVGDLFHSVENKELQLFTRWRNDFSQIDFQLVKGNHDLLKNDWYQSANINVSDNHLSVGNFCFIHDISDACTDSPSIDYFFSGHIHPCVSLKGLGKQSVKLPCFYFNHEFAVLPAFGKFTGTAQIQPKSGDHVFAILPAGDKSTAHIVKL